MNTITTSYTNKQIEQLIRDDIMRKFGISNPTQATFDMIFNLTTHPDAFRTGVLPGHVSVEVSF